MPVRRWGLDATVNIRTTGDQRDPSVAALTNGGYVVAWEDPTVGTNSVQYQRYDAQGNRAGAVGSLGTGTSTSTSSPSITGRSDGSFWIGFDSGDTNINPNVAWFDANGAYLFVNPFTTVTGVQDQTAIGRSGTRVVGAWHDAELNGGDIRASIRTSDGSLAVAPFTVNSTTAGNQYNPEVAELSNGRLAFAWADASSNRIVARTFDANGANPTAEVDVYAEGGILILEQPQIIALSNGGFLVAFTDALPSFPELAFGVHARMFDGSGNAFGPEIFLNTTLPGSQFFPEIVALANGGFLAVWFEAETLSIRGQAFDAFGSRAGGEFVVSTVTFNYGGAPSLSAALLNDGRVVVTWEGQYAAGTDADTSGYSVHSQIIDPRDGGIIGDANANTMYGHDVGGDEMTGLAGADKLYGLGGDDRIDGGIGDDTLDGGSGNDYIVGSYGADTLVGGDGNDQLDGGAGADVLNGDANFDLARYDGSATGVVVRLDVNFGINGDAQGDQLSNIEGLIGSANQDFLFGDANANALLGLAGDDWLYGQAGADELRGGDGTDQILGGAGADLMYGESGSDQFWFLGSEFQAGVWDIIYDFSEVVGNFDYLRFEGIAANQLIIGDNGGNAIVTTSALNYTGGLIIMNFQGSHLGDQLIFA